LTRSENFTQEVVTCQPQIRQISGKVRQRKTDVLTTVKVKSFPSHVTQKGRALIPDSPALGVARCACLPPSLYWYKRYCLNMCVVPQLELSAARYPHHIDSYHFSDDQFSICIYFAKLLTLSLYKCGFI